MSALLKLRDYQTRSIAAIHTEWDAGVRRPAVVLPTGAGKTVVFAHLAEQFLAANPGRRVLVLAHTNELIEQAAHKIRLVAPDRSIGIVKAERNEVHAEIVVGSVQSLRSEKRRAQVRRVGLIIVDECHHATARTYQDILTYFGAMTPLCTECREASDQVSEGAGERCWPSHCPDEGCVTGITQNGPVYVAGFTATLVRGDKAKLSDIWESVAFKLSIAFMIRSGYLLDVKGKRVEVPDLNLSKVKVSGGDYQEGALGEALEEAFAPEIVAKAYVEHAADRKGILFAPLVHTAYAFAEAFNTVGIVTEVVHGALPKEERRGVLARLRSGETQVVCNAMVLCLDEETEILTDSGWVGIDAMTLEHRVANWDQGKVFFREPTEVVVRPRGGEEPMYVLETPRRSIRVTGRHRMLYRTTSSGPFLKKPVDDIAGRVVALPTTGVARPEVAAPISLDEARLIGFWLGDGSANRPSRGGIEYTLSQSLRYPKIIQWVDDLLERVGLDYVRYDKGHYTVPHVRWSLPRGTGGKSQARKGVRHLEDWLDKDGSQLLWNLDREQFSAFLEGLWYADGDHGLAESGRPDSFRIYAKRKHLLEQIQAIASVRGWTTALRLESAPRDSSHAQVYRLSFSSRIQHRMHREGTIQLEHDAWREERVWCVKTETKNIITRRHGSVTVMGNTEGFDEPTVSCVVVARPTKSAGLYQQMVGRGLRPDLTLAPDERGHALILDVTGVSRMHGLQALVDLTTRDDLPEDVDEDLSLLELEDLILDEPEEREDGSGAGEAETWYAGPAETREFDPLGRDSDRTWAKTPEGTYYLAAGVHGYVFLHDSVNGEPGTYDLVLAGKQVEPGQRYVRARLSEHLGLDFEMAVAWGEELAAELGGFGTKTLTAKKAKWRKEDATSGQAFRVRRVPGWGGGKIRTKRVNDDPAGDVEHYYVEETGERLTKGMASEIIDGHVAACVIDPLVRFVKGMNR